LSEILSCVPDESIRLNVLDWLGQINIRPIGKIKKAPDWIGGWLDFVSFWATFDCVSGLGRLE
jgi:hypothetical protein